MYDYFTEVLIEDGKMLSVGISGKTINRSLAVLSHSVLREQTQNAKILDETIISVECKTN